MHEYSTLENFWKRFNKVSLDKLALEKEKQGMMVENQQLRTLLKQYLDGISVNDEILSQVNPLFIVNNKTNVKWVEGFITEGYQNMSLLSQLYNGLRPYCKSTCNILRMILSKNLPFHTIEKIWFSAYLYILIYDFIILLSNW